MLRVDEAVAYFKAHNPENSQLDTLGALRRNGQLKLEEEFRMVRRSRARAWWHDVARPVVVLNTAPPLFQKLLTRYSVAPSPDHVADVLDTFPVRQTRGGGLVRGSVPMPPFPAADARAGLCCRTFAGSKGPLRLTH